MNQEFNRLVGDIFIRGIQNVLRRIGYEYVEDLKQQLRSKKEEVGN